jgi:hypothetical protein
MPEITGALRLTRSHPVLSVATRPVVDTHHIELCVHWYPRHARLGHRQGA